MCCHNQALRRMVEQLAARRAHNPEAAGSSPVSARLGAVLEVINRLQKGRPFLVAGATARPGYMVCM